MLQVIVTGAAGKMGKANIKVVSEDKDAKLAGAVEAAGCPALGRDAGETAGLGRLGVSIVDGISNTGTSEGVIIDFSSPACVAAHIEYAKKKGMGLVIGTTGLSDTDLSAIKEAGKAIPVIWAPNYSVGVSLIAKLAELAARTLGPAFDAEIVEAHHRMKKDAPSGTAIKLMNAVKTAFGAGDAVYGRQGITGLRPAGQIGVHAVRGGDVVGDHTVYFLGDGERVEITHKATSRETFARGALRAAKFIMKRGKGFYTMEDVLGF